MTNSARIPYIGDQPMLWLDLQPEYIDVNIDKFVQYLYDRREESEHDDFYRSSISLLRQRVRQVVDDLSTHPIGAMVDENIDRASTISQLRILSLYMLVEAYDSLIDAHEALACMYLLLVRLMPEAEFEGLLSDAVRALTTTGRILLKYSWPDMRAFEPYLMCQALRRTEMLLASNDGGEWYASAGSAMLKGGVLQILSVRRSELKKTKMHESLTLCDGRVRVCVPDAMRLSLSKSGDFDALSTFFFNMRKAMVRTEEKPRQQYRFKDGARTLLRVVYADGERLLVETIDPEYERLTGHCYYSGKFRYNIKEFARYLKVGQVILGDIVRSSGAQSEFDIAETFWEFLFEIYQYTETGTLMRASYLNSRDGYQLWWTEYGFAISVPERDYEGEPLLSGQVATLSVVGYQTSKGFINGKIEEFDETGMTIDSELGYRRCVEAFGECEEVPSMAQETASLIDERYMRLMARVLYVMQKYEGAPVERYHLLGVVGLLGHLCGDSVSMHYADFVASSLCNMVWFAGARYDRIEVPVPDDSIADLPGVRRRENIIYTLMQYGANADDEFLESMMKGDDPMLANLAQLVQSGNRLAGVLSGNVQRQIEMEITRQLRVGDEADTDFSDADNDSFGVEDDRKEFKTSFVFPPDNHMQMDREEQRRNVFKGVCAMLNSREGGVIYLGVNDHGKVVGLQADLKALQLHTMDSYMRFISDSAKRTFGLELIPYIHLEAMHDDQVVAIRVEPCDFKIVEMEGIAYVRTNAESRKMDKATRAILLNRKLHFDATRARIESTISTAIEHCTQVELKSYRPIDRAEVDDYIVEPFAFTKGNRHVWAYDVASRQVQLFALSRIGDVHLKDTPWQHTADHKEGRMDIFHSISGTPIRVQLRLDPLAYNMLLEEYDGYESELTSAKDGSYLLDTEVLGLDGIGRFYLGFAQHISIINAPGLKKWASQYARQYLLD